MAAGVARAEEVIEPVATRLDNGVTDDRGEVDERGGGGREDVRPNTGGRRVNEDLDGSDDANEPHCNPGDVAERCVLESAPPR